ncbi:Alpha/Beta hydrolase protein [Boeremia exigua]|uniref:Alpha/Beta hydrolase protein n=1 Tax=Boeremia exigua TaxID=749465 RepID=UPI001E8D4503|nr:Alpha/Beta hydrolase protein [Boeremia exigua]KAH6628970.1 Alpha/Beta hydrolase protein [Boeremia exigua]
MDGRVTHWLGQCHRNYNVSTTDIRSTSYSNLIRGVTIPSGRTYRYVFSPPFDSTKPYILFLHGFPETSHEWKAQITYFTEQGFGVVVPDLLGYGGTDKPESLTAYSFTSMAGELNELLECEGVEKFIAVAHDFGAPVLSRLLTHQSSRVTAAAFLGGGYLPLQARLDAASITAFNNDAKDRYGYEIYGYWFTNNEDSMTELVEENLDSFLSLAFTRNQTVWRENFAPLGAVRQWLTENRTATDVYVSQVYYEQWKTIIMSNGGMEAPLRWYKATMAGISNPTEDGT